MASQLDERISRLRRRKRESRAGFKFRPFSHNQRTVLTWWSEKSPLSAYDGIIADGAVRSGKTMAMSLGFVLWAMNCFSEQSFAICGKTLGSVERNILVWLRQMLPSRGYRISEKRSEHMMTVTSREGTSNRFYFFGGKDEGSQDLIQGMTLAGVLFDEAALMPESFVSQATARCSVPHSKWWFNCNPEGPFHWFKRGWIDHAQEKNLLYLHFTMKDNLSLSDEIRARYESMYAGVFYRRYILGEWCAAEGLVYPMFDASCHVGEPSESAQRYYLSCDYGTHNPFALGLISVRSTERGEVYCLEREMYHD
ncbi:MAG: PBSX family phage terminase large subunit, partial [Clostridia bacterium]|nr:PBSX family phage terminase large subunit [Clostridia bacterium]